MPQNITDVDTFTDPIVAMADSDPKVATYVRTAIQGLANRTRYLFTGLDPASPVSREWCLWPGAAIAFSGWTLDLTTKQWSSTADSAQIDYPLPKLPPGAKITAIKIRVTPGEARAGVNRFHIALFSHGGVLGGQAQIGATTYDDGTGGSQTITLSGLSTVIDDTGYYFVRITAGNTGAAHADVFSVVAVVFDDKGPRIPT